MSALRRRIVSRRRQGHALPRTYAGHPSLARYQENRCKFVLAFPNLSFNGMQRMVSMSNMKHDAIVSAGIPILERIELPDELIPEDSKVPFFDRSLPSELTSQG